MRVDWPSVDGTREGKWYANFIDATGQAADPTLDPSPFTQSLIRNGFVEEVLVPFRGSTSDASDSHVIARAGKPFFCPPGGHIDLRNFSLWSKQAPGADAARPLYYMGPMSMGQVASPQDLSVITTAAERGVQHLVSSGVLAKPNANDEDPCPMWDWAPNTQGDLNRQMCGMSAQLHNTGIVRAKLALATSLMSVIVEHMSTTIDVSP